MFNLAFATEKKKSNKKRPMERKKQPPNQIKLHTNSAKINNFFSTKPWAHFIIFPQKVRWLSTIAVIINSRNYNNHASVWTLLCCAVSPRPAGLTFSRLWTLEWGKLLSDGYSIIPTNAITGLHCLWCPHSVPAGQMSQWGLRGFAGNTHSRLNGLYIVIYWKIALVNQRRNLKPRIFIAIIIYLQ